MYNYIRDLGIFRRNAANALDNTGDSSHIPSLEEAISRWPEEPVAEAAKWAIRRLQENGQQPACGKLG